MSELPIKPISDIEEKQTVSENDKILILDSVSEEARLASKDELKGDKGDTGDTWPQWIQWPQGIQWEKGDKWDKGDQWIQWERWPQGIQWPTWAKGDKGDKGDTGASIVSAAFSWNNIVFTKDDTNTVTLSDAKTELKGDKGDTWNTGATGNGIDTITSSKSWKTTTVTITETDGTVTSFQLQDGADGTGAWDMTQAIYDPNGLQADAFDYDNFINTPTVNTRQFILPSLSSLTVAQQIYEYALWGDGAVIRYNNEDYFLSWFDNGDPIFLRTKLESATSNDWTNTYMKDTGLKFTIVSANVTAISVVNNTNPWYLATGVNYATPYTPEYPWSPATKKYVDDSIGGLGTAASKDTWTSAWNVPVLDVNGKLDTTILPWVALTDTFTVTNKNDLTGLTTAEQGDIGIVTSESKTYVLSGGSYATLSNWKEILTPTDTVISVNSKTGAVVLNPDDLSDSTSTNKFVTASEKTTWNGKQDLMQVSTLPTASASNEGKIYQYVGTTTASYTNGYFYKSVENSGSYSWEEVQLQEDQSIEFKTIEEYRNLTPAPWKTYFIYSKWSTLKEFPELQTMAVADVVTELNTKATDYYDKFEWEQRMMDYNSSKYFCKDIWDWTPYEWTWWSVYYNTSTEVWALDSWE